MGDREDYNKWAEIVGDSDWKWDGERGVKQRLRKIERQHLDMTEMHAKYLDITSLESHSKDGMVDLTFDQEWPKVGTLTFEAAKELGVTRKYSPSRARPLAADANQMIWNGDMNTGHPRGWGLVPSTFYQGSRVTSSRAYLASPPKNFTILTEKVVTKVLFDKSKKAIGVQTSSGSKYIANKEVILSAGAIDSPRILLLSGIRLEAELSRIPILVIHNLLGVGKNLKDHPICTITLLLKPREKVGTQDLDPLHPLYNVGVQMPSAWLSPPAIYASEEYAALDEETKVRLLKVPLIEFGTNNLPMTVRDLQEGTEVISFFAGVMNPQSCGGVTLSSANPLDPPVIDLNFCSHPYGKRAGIEGFRSLMEFSGLPTYAAITESRIEGPFGDSDEEIREHCKRSIGPIYRFGGTCKMGNESDEMCVVDMEFKVRGARGLRVVDHAVAPLMSNNHTQSTCYLIVSPHFQV